MKRILPLLLLCSAASPQTAPPPASPAATVEIPADLTSGYFKQAYVIADATFHQTLAWGQMLQWGTDNACVPVKVRDENDELNILCQPKDHKGKRPTVEMPKAITSDYYKQAYVIARATLRQTLEWGRITEWSGIKVCTPMKTRD